MKAKISEFNGVYFRSRLEARWCEFFTGLGVRFKYEPETIKTSLGGYVPDFYFRSLNSWVEIKGKAATEEEIVKLIDVCITTKKSGLIISGYPKVYQTAETPHLSNCTCWFISSEGRRVKFSADELYQVIKDFRLLVEFKNCYSQGLNKVDLYEFLRCKSISPAKAKFKPKNLDLISTTKEIYRLLSKANKTLNQSILKAN